MSLTRTAQVLQLKKSSSQGGTAAKTWRVGSQACMEAEHRRRGNTLAEQWIPRIHIGKGPGQPPQLACTRAAAGQRDSGCLESGQSTRGEGTHARRAVDPAETHWQGPRTAAAASLHRAAAGQRDSGRLESGQSTRGEAEHARRDCGVPAGKTCIGRRRQLGLVVSHTQSTSPAMHKSRVEAALQQRLGDLAGKHAWRQSTRGEGTHARRAVDPAETHWQGPRTAAAASLHKAAAGQGDSSQDRALEAREHTLAELCIPRSTHWQGHRIAAAASLHREAAGQRVSGRLESAGQSTRCAGTQAQGWRTLVAPLRGPQGTACRVAKHSAACGNMWTQVARSRDRALDAQEHKHRAEEPSWPLCGGPSSPMQGRQGSAASAPSGPGLEVPRERKKVARTRPRRRGARGERFAGGCRAPWRGPSRHSAHLYPRQATWLGPSGSDAHAEVPSLLTEAAKC